MSQLPQARPLFPPESLFAGEEWGTWPDALDVQISTATDTDVRKSQANGFGACEGHLCSPCAHISIQEMTNKTRANSAPCRCPMEYKYTKGKSICSWIHSSKIQSFVLWYPHKNISLWGRDGNSRLICRSEGTVQADTGHYVYIPTL